MAGEAIQIGPFAALTFIAARALLVWESRLNLVMLRDEAAHLLARVG